MQTVQTIYVLVVCPDITLDVLIYSEILRFGLYRIGCQEKSIFLLHVDAIDASLTGLCVCYAFTASYRVDEFGKFHLIETVLIVYIII